MNSLIARICAALLMVALCGCGPLDGTCGNTIKQSAPSPDGKYVATALIRDCGATTSYSPQVHLGTPGTSVPEAGNVFIGHRSEQIQVKWISATNLMIYSDCEVRRHVTNYNGITITFEKRAPDANDR